MGLFHMNHLIRLLLLPSASAYIFFSGIFTSLATNLFTSDHRATTQLYDFVGLGIFPESAVHLSRVISTLIVGAALFWLGNIREDAGRKADFVRGDETTEAEYSGLVRAGFQQKSRQALMAFALLTFSLLGVIDTSLVL